MEYFDKFKNFIFGKSHQNETAQSSTRLPAYYNDQSKERENFFSNEPPTYPPRHFEMFSDPIKMHEYFEQQMSEMLKNFGFQEFGHSFFNGFNEGSEFGGMLEEAPQSSGDLRDQFLKKGYEKPSPPRLDKNLDDQLNVGDFDSVFGHKDGPNKLVPHEVPVPDTQKKNFFFGQTVSKKIIRNPDGSVEKHSTVKDNEGNEETTITRQLGDKEVTIIKKRDKFGKEEIIENLINVDENEKNAFLSPPPLAPQPNYDDNSFNNFPFNKFFK